MGQAGGDSLTPISSPTISDLPVQIGRRSVEADKRHAVMHVISG